MTAGPTTPMRSTVVLVPPGRSPAEPPPALVLCSHCAAVADGTDPPGWVTVGDLGLQFAYGVCPACRVEVYEAPAGPGD